MTTESLSGVRNQPWMNWLQKNLLINCDLLFCVRLRWFLKTQDLFMKRNSHTSRNWVSYSRNLYSTRASSVHVTAHLNRKSNNILFQKMCVTSRITFPYIFPIAADCFHVKTGDKCTSEFIIFPLEYEKNGHKWKLNFNNNCHWRRANIDGKYPVYRIT